MFCCFVHSSPHFTTALGQVDQVLRLDPRSSSDPAGCCPSQSVCVLPGRGVSSCCVLPGRGVSSCCVLPSRGVSSCCVLPSRGVSSCCVLPSRGVSFPVGVCPSQSGCVLSSRCVSSCCVLPSRVCVLLLCPSQSGVCPLAVSFPVSLCPLAVSFPVGCVSSCCVLPSRAHRKSPQIHILPSNRRPTLRPGVSTRSVHRAAPSSSTVRAAWRSQHLLHTV